MMMEQEGKTKKAISFVETCRKIKLSRSLLLMNQEDSSMYKVSFEHNKSRKWIHNKRRSDSGRPRFDWTE